MNDITQKEIEEAVAALQSGTGEISAAAAIDFCTAWPTAKTVLGFLSNVPQLRWIIPIVITVGDSYFAKKCL